jgi:AcrR family transcriptional regulator
MARVDRDRVLDGALTCIARVGLAKTTLDDVAREAGCVRATVYRTFANKQHLLNALVERETGRLQATVLAAAAAAPTLGDAITVTITTAAHALVTHEPLAFIATNEPEVLLPYLAFEKERAFYTSAAALAAPAFARFLDDVDATRLGEWIARITLSYLCDPPEHFDVFDEQQVKALIVDFVLPGFTKPVGNDNRIRLEGITQ